MTTDTKNKPSTKRPREMARNPKAQNGGVAEQSSTALDKPPLATKAEPELSTPKAPTKTDIILGLLTRGQGATLKQMVDATGWLPHTTRAALTGLKKKGHAVTSTKADNVRTYRVIAVQSSGANSSSDLKDKPNV